MDEEPLLLWVGNHPATDLCNTEPIIGGRRVELLPDLETVSTWARLAGVATTVEAAAIGGPDRARTLGFVHRLRTAVRAALEPAAPDPAAVHALNEVLGQDRGMLQVVPAATEPVTLVAPSPGAQLRLDIAAAVLDIFRHDLGRVRRCANPVCVLLFLDVSKSGRRRWCDMATCGNRAKAAAHYARARTGAGSVRPGR